MIQEEIAHWETIFSKTGSEKRIIEAAFLSIAISLEHFLTEKFITFSSDNSSPVSTFRKLSFDSREQLSDIIKGDSQRFVDYNKAINRCGKHIFTKNPFDLIFNDSIISKSIDESRYIRNFLAHRSNESKDSYIRNVLYGAVFIEPGEYLVKRHPNLGLTNYYRIMQDLKKAEDILNNQQLATMLSST